MKLAVVAMLALAIVSVAGAKKCNPKNDTSCCRDRKPGPRKCTKWVKKKPTKCARKKFQGKCRASCDDYWGPKTDIEFCTLPGAMSWPGSKKQLLAKMGGAPAKKPPAGSVDWTTGVPCVCTKYTDGATAEDAATTGLCQKKLPEHDGLGGEAIPCRSLHVDSGTTPPKNRCTGDYEFCTAHPPSPPPPPPSPPAGTPSDTMPSPPAAPPPFAPTECTLENLQKIGTELTADQLPIDCRGKEIAVESKGPIYLPDMGGDKVDFTSASLLESAATGYYDAVQIGSAVGGRFRGSTIETKGKRAGIYFSKKNEEGEFIDEDGNILGADLTGANFEEASFTTEGDYSPIFFPSAKLNGANFDKASLTTSSSYAYISFGMSWYGTGADADLTDASFEKAFLMTGGENVKGNTDITFSDSTLTRANFKEASIKTTGSSTAPAHIKFENSDLTDAKFDGAYFNAEYGYVYNSDGSKLPQGQTPYDAP